MVVRPELVVGLCIHEARVAQLCMGPPSLPLTNIHACAVVSTTSPGAVLDPLGHHATSCRHGGDEIQLSHRLDPELCDPRAPPPSTLVPCLFFPVQFSSVSHIQSSAHLDGVHVAKPVMMDVCPSPVVLFTPCMDWLVQSVQ